ncbi:MAG: GAF domain-containing protein [Deltaproteobacteria bacterium]|nr:GAF domain-containing protein [Deltaproteobacteria bacterium]
MNFARKEIEVDPVEDFLDGMPMKVLGSKQQAGGSQSEVGSFRLVSRGESSGGNSSLSERMDDLQRLISECVTGFLTMSLDRLDSEVRLSIRRIVELLALDRGFVAQYSDLEKRLVCTHYYEAPGSKPAVPSCEISIPPWVLQKVLQRECVSFSQVADLPEEAEQAKAYFTSMGTRSHISLPLEIDGEVIGCLTMENTRAEIAWPEAIFTMLRPMAAVFALTLERKRKKLQFLEKMRFETLLVDLSARFVQLETEEVDRHIEQALEIIGNFFSADRCGILQGNNEDNRSVKITHAWYAEGLERIGNDVNIAHLFPWSYVRLFMDGEIVDIPRLEDLPPEAEKDRETFMVMGVKSSLTIPLSSGKNTCHLFALNNLFSERLWPQEYIPRLRLIGEMFINALKRKEYQQDMKRSCEEIRELKDKLQVEAEFLRSEIRSSRNREEIVGQSDALSKVLLQVEQVAPTDTTVLICGETGTGKELVAQAIHDSSLYRDKLMVKVNCASLPASLVESELFGREKGAYTGALTRQIGRFELADGSTILLDEIAELPLELQAKLLRVLQENTFERLGSPKTIKVHVRVIAATNRNIFEEVKKGNFREDLYYRLNVFPITVPPLRDRIDDIPMLVWAFVHEFCEKMGKQVSKISKRDMEALQQYSWPGNIRELRNIIEHAVIVSSGGVLQVTLPKDLSRDISWCRSLEEVESQHILNVLRHTGGRIKGDGGAARILNMIPSTLNSRMKKLGITLRDEKGEISY